MTQKEKNSIESAGKEMVVEEEDKEDWIEIKRGRGVKQMQEGVCVCVCVWVCGCARGGDAKADVPSIYQKATNLESKTGQVLWKRSKTEGFGHFPPVSP